MKFIILLSFLLYTVVYGYINNIPNCRRIISTSSSLYATSTKFDLKTYLDHYRILTDAVNIKNAFIINIGIQFEITVLSNYNSNEVLLNCINAIKTYFSIDAWQINQPIIKSDLTNTIGSVRGVQNVVNVVFENLYDPEFNYSGNVYDLNASTKNGIIYPSLDPSIFELKFLDQDIKGRVVSH
jgi:hypothetical protein